MIIATCLYVMLQALDVLTTAVLLHSGGMEGNSIYYALGTPLFLLGKFLSVLAVVGFIKYWPDWAWPFKYVLLGIVVPLSLALVVWNSGQIVALILR